VARLRRLAVAVAFVGGSLTLAASAAQAAPEAGGALCPTNEVLNTDTHECEIPGDEPASSINWYHFSYDKEKQGPPLLFVIFNFVILLYLLKRFGGPSISQFLRQKYEETLKTINDARDIKKRAQDKLDEYEKRIAGLDAEVAKIAADLKAEAEDERRRLIAAAEDEAARLKADAERTISLEMARIRAELESEVVGRALDAAEKLLRQNLRPDDDKRLMDNYVAGLAAPAAIKPTAGGVGGVS
jgi:F-type H+-transporting ATPase subunit b